MMCDTLLDLNTNSIRLAAGGRVETSGEFVGVGKTTLNLASRKGGGTILH